MGFEDYINEQNNGILETQLRICEMLKDSNEYDKRLADLVASLINEIFILMGAS